MSKIQIFTVLGKNGVLFSRFLQETMTALSSGNHDLEFNCFMSSRAMPPPGWNVLEYILKQKHTSLNHTTGLNRAIDYIDGDYVLFCDVDVAMLVPDWDQHLINTMEEQQMHILGVSHWEHPRGYQGFPIVTFFISRSLSYLRAQPDLRPELCEYPNKHGVGAKNITIQTSLDSYIYGIPQKSQILLDSGWQLPYKFKTLNIHGGVLDKTTAYFIQNVPQCWNIRKKPGICHKGKSSKRRQSHCLNFTRSVASYLNKTHGVVLKEYLQ